jgi:hypothetical protein
MQLKPINIKDYTILQPYFRNQPYRLSVYSLLSIIVWSCQKYVSSYAIHDGAVVLGNEAVNNPQDHYLILPVNSSGYFTPEYLHRLAVQLDYPEYWFVPGDYLDQFESATIETTFFVTEQPEYEDYIYLTDDLALLKGNRFSKKRNLIHQFNKSYVDTGKVAVDRLTTDNAEECLDFLTKWCEDHDDCEGPDNESLACEKRAMTTALHAIDALEGMGILIRIDGVVSAIAIASRLNASMGVLNFEKAFSDVRGLYQFLDNECAKRLFSGYRYINKESDMGIPDLAQSKKSYHPVERLKSYKLALR